MQDMDVNGLFDIQHGAAPASLCLLSLSLSLP